MTAAEVAELRERLGLGVEDFALVVGVHARTVYRWEQGALAPEGPAEAVLRAMRGALASWPDRVDELKRLAGESLNHGGLAWLLEELMFDWLAEAPTRE